MDLPCTLGVSVCHQALQYPLYIKSVNEYELTWHNYSLIMKLFLVILSLSRKGSYQFLVKERAHNQ